MENLKPTINEKDEWDISEIDSTPKTWGELYKEQHADKTETEKPKLSDDEHNRLDRELNKAAELVESAPTPRPAKEETAKNLGKKASLFSFFKPPKK